MEQLLMTASLKNPLNFDLSCLPYQIRAYRPGDEKAWESIVETVFHAVVRFDELKADPAYRPDRVFFAVDPTGIPVATATCWEVPTFYPKCCAVLHMVGVLPDHRAHSLGRIVSAAAMEKARADGFSMIALRTDDFRVPAVRTYLKLGFIPRPLDESQIERWRNILLALDRGALAEHLPEYIWNKQEI